MTPNRAQTGGLDAYAGYCPRPLDAVRADLEALCALVEKWQRVQNLVSRETLGALWDRHILDSLQLLPLMGTSGPPLTVADIGSGGGFPALPLAIALKGGPARFHLIEANGRKCAFLNAARRELGLAITVHNSRVEAVEPPAIGGFADIVTARALAPLEVLLGHIVQVGGPDTRALVHKGREYGEEIVKADSVWRFDVVVHESATDREGVVLEITRPARRARSGACA